MNIHLNKDIILVNNFIIKKLNYKEIIYFIELKNTFKCYIYLFIDNKKFKIKMKS